MDQRDSHCPYFPSSEPTAKGTVLVTTKGKEDPVELDSNHYSQSCFTYSIELDCYSLRVIYLRIKSFFFLMRDE
ncbi:uncharacterized protein Gasu_61680 [Galdieria sulphuraria]|uniref:Uncharacterized protein n=1 Tax=Galdieria sulphuraria TaxID=130081 RepID=M2XR92_GALSU|nr:uncharacterized protein Gasu_61680 [Galdieria sulphuraria]EME26183.1 hypothetical protein Gasu_61680 [Galdieria sulphuraria]|eukprot:XP_005702703.1 hypothetical protein Gasu_61680 [Galdieria sulphuraria]